MYSCASTPHVQPRQGLQQVQGVPWVREVHARHQDHLVPAFLSLPVGDTATVSLVVITSGWTPSRNEPQLDFTSQMYHFHHHIMYK